MMTEGEVQEFFNIAHTRQKEFTALYNRYKSDKKRDPTYKGLSETLQEYKLRIIAVRKAIRSLSSYKTNPDLLAAKQREKEAWQNAINAQNELWEQTERARLEN